MVYRHVAVYSMIALFCSLGARADVSLPPLFGDHAILMRGASTAVWGQASKGEKVIVTLAGRSAETVAPDDGWWTVRLDLTGVGDGPFELVAKGKSNEVVSRDVLVGEVWLASGQSNMEFKFHSDLFGDVLGSEKLFERAKGRPIRVFSKRLDWSMRRAMDHQNGKWILPTPEELRNCTAVGFSFIEALQSEIGGVVGLVDISIGGTRPIQWTDHERLMDIKWCSVHWTNQCEQIERSDNFNRWLSKNVPGETCHTPYSELMASDKWEKNCPLPTDVRRGVVYYRKVIDVPKGFTDAAPSDRYRLEGFTVDKTFLRLEIKDRFTWPETSQLLLGEHARSIHNWAPGFKDVVMGGSKIELLLRFEAVLPDAKVKIENLRLERNVSVPISLDGWDRLVWAVYPELDKSEALPIPFNVPQSRMENFYNSMVWPFRNLAFRGCIWYQGCSNTSMSDPISEYPVVFSRMVENWRDVFNHSSMPFYWCQLAGYGGFQSSPGRRSRHAEVREAQRRSRDVIPEPREMAVIFDTGESECHGRDKIPAGRRLAAIALAKTYGRSVPYRSPLMASVRRDGEAMIVDFDTAGAKLEARPVAKTYLVNATIGAKPTHRHSPESQLEGFELRGADGKWYWADAQIVGLTSVRVTAKGCVAPEIVRYNWGDMNIGNLWSDTGFPASCFTTER